MTSSIGLLITGMAASEWRYRGIPVVTKRRFFLTDIEGEKLELHNAGINSLFVRKLSIRYKDEELDLYEYKKVLEKEGKYLVDERGWNLVQDGGYVFENQGRGFFNILPGSMVHLFRVKSQQPTPPEDDFKDQSSFSGSMKLLTNYDQVLIDPSTTSLIIRYSIYLWPLPFSIPLKITEKLD